MEQLVAIAFVWGVGFLGVVVLLCGLSMAHRTSSVIAFAVVAALLFAAQLVLLFIWLALVDTSGGRRRDAFFVSAAVTTVVLVAWFLAFKLRRTWGKTNPATDPWRDGARIAAGICVAYVVFFAVRWLAYWNLVASSLAYGVTMALSLLIAWGLWQHRRWAWYAGVAGATYVLARIAWYSFIPWPSNALYMLAGTSVGLQILILLALLLVLLFSNARARLLNP